MVENFIRASCRASDYLRNVGTTESRLGDDVDFNFGQTGPYRDYKAQDILIYAMGGPMHQTGVAEREPIKMAGNLMQYHGAMAATATLVGVCGAQLQGIGQHIDVSSSKLMPEQSIAAPPSHGLRL